MKLAGSVSEETVLASFGEAEIHSPRWGVTMRQLLGTEVFGRVTRQTSDDWAECDRRAVVQAIRSLRAGLIEPVVEYTTEWHSGRISVVELYDLRITAGSWWGDLTKNWTLVELVSSLEAGKRTPDRTFSDQWRCVRDGFNEAALHGLPILVSDRTDGVWTIMEGTTRLAAVVSRASQGLWVPEELPAYAGIGEGANSPPFR